MFNGIIKNTGIVKYIKKNIKSMNITVYTDLKIGNNMLGSSISCDGVCLTLISKKNKLLTFYLSQETIMRSNFSKIKVPCLVMVGELDKLTPPSIAEEINALIPNSRLKIIEGAGHLINIEKPKIFNKSIFKFLGHFN